MEHGKRGAAGNSLHVDTAFAYKNGNFSDVMYEPSSLNRRSPNLSPKASARPIPNHSPTSSLRTSPRAYSYNINTPGGQYDQGEPEQPEPPGWSEPSAFSKPGLTVSTETHAPSPPVTPSPHLTAISPSVPSSVSQTRSTSSIFRRRNVHISSTSTMDPKLLTTPSSASAGSGDDPTAVPGSIPDMSAWLSPADSCSSYYSCDGTRLEAFIPNPPSRRRILGLSIPGSQLAPSPPPFPTVSHTGQLTQPTATGMGLEEAGDQSDAASQQQQAARRSLQPSAAQRTTREASAPLVGAPPSSGWTLPASRSSASSSCPLWTPNHRRQGHASASPQGPCSPPPAAFAHPGNAHEPAPSAEYVSRVYSRSQTLPVRHMSKVQATMPAVEEATSMPRMFVVVGDSKSSVDMSTVYSPMQLMHDGSGPLQEGAAERESSSQSDLLRMVSIPSSVTTAGDGKSSAGVSRVNSLSQLLHGGRSAEGSHEEGVSAASARVCSLALATPNFFARSAHVWDAPSSQDLDRVGSLSELMNDGRGVARQPPGATAAPPPEAWQDAATAPSSFSRPAHIDVVAPSIEFGELHRISHLMYDGRRPAGGLPEDTAPLAAVSASVLQLGVAQSSFSRVGYREWGRSQSTKGVRELAGDTKGAAPVRLSQGQLGAVECSPFARSALHFEEHPAASPCIMVTPAASRDPGSQRAAGAEAAASTAASSKADDKLFRSEGHKAPSSHASPLKKLQAEQPTQRGSEPSLGGGHRWFKLGGEGAFKARSSSFASSPSLSPVVAPLITTSPALAVQTSSEPKGPPVSSLSPLGRRQAWTSGEYTNSSP